jgi:hypothetical protein
VEYLGSFKYRVLSVANRDNFISSFLFVSLLILSLMSLLWLGMEALESGYHFFFPDFRGNGFRLSPFTMMLAMGLHYVTFQGMFLLFLVSQELLLGKDAEFSQRFFHLLRCLCGLCGAILISLE